MAEHFPAESWQSKETFGEWIQWDAFDYIEDFNACSCFDDVAITKAEQSPIYLHTFLSEFRMNLHTLFKIFLKDWIFVNQISFEILLEDLDILGFSESLESHSLGLDLWGNVIEIKITPTLVESDRPSIFYHGKLIIVYSESKRNRLVNGRGANGQSQGCKTQQFLGISAHSLILYIKISSGLVNQWK